jgi:hypothetical protein
VVFDLGLLVRVTETRALGPREPTGVMLQSGSSSSQSCALFVIKTVHF